LTISFQFLYQYGYQYVTVLVQKLKSGVKNDDFITAEQAGDVSHFFLYVFSLNVFSFLL